MFVKFTGPEHVREVELHQDGETHQLVWEGAMASVLELDDDIGQMVIDNVQQMREAEPEEVLLYNAAKATIEQAAKDEKFRSQRASLGAHSIGSFFEVPGAPESSEDAMAPLKGEDDASSKPDVSGTDQEVAD